jgi:hypothetical protein
VSCDLPDLWWRDPERLRAEHNRHGSLEAAAAVHGFPSYRTLCTWWRKLGLGPHQPGPKTGTHAPRDSGGDDTWLIDTLRRLGDEATVEQIADHADVSPRRVRETAERLGLAGYRVEAEGDKVAVQRVRPAHPAKLHALLFDGELVRVGVVSDTHLGSHEEALDELHVAYDRFAAEGITEVWHLGDISCGVEVFGRRQHTQAVVHTLDEARDYVAANYPQRDGIRTRLIGGNHDLEGAAGRVGFDLAAAVAALRDDIDYLGPYEAWLEVRPGTGRWVHLLHPTGGMSYSYSYKAQKIVDGYTSGRKPVVALLGHWHVRGAFRARDVEVLFTGAFEWQTPFLTRLGLQPAVGFHVVEMRVADDGTVVEWTPRWFPFYAGRSVLAAA